eukprot:57380-Prorocentrum_minimum.AAC.2
MIRHRPHPATDALASLSPIVHFPTAPPLPYFLPLLASRKSLCFATTRRGRGCTWVWIETHLSFATGLHVLHADVAVKNPWRSGALDQPVVAGKKSESAWSCHANVRLHYVLSCQTWQLEYATSGVPERKNCLTCVPPTQVTQIRIYQTRSPKGVIYQNAP